jgi:hypothetical protein
VFVPAGPSATKHGPNSYHLRILKIVELELLFCQNTLMVSYCQKLVSCGEDVDYGKKGEFLNL